MKRVFLILVIATCYLSAFSQEKDINQIRYEAFRNLNAGMYPNELVVRLGFAMDINRYFFGGIFIGIGLLSEDSKKPSTYTGTLNLHEYKFIFDNGKLKEKSIDSTKIGSDTISGQYIYEFIGKTQTSWSLVNGKFNSKTVAIKMTEEEERILQEQTEHYIIERDKRLKEVSDSLTNIGYKLITEKGFDSFIIGKTSLQEIVSALGPNYLREEESKNVRHSKITYSDLGISFNIFTDQKTKNTTLTQIQLRSPFKGFHIAGSLKSNFWGVELGKTTINDLRSRNYRGFRIDTWNLAEENYVRVELNSGMSVNYFILFDDAENTYDPAKDYIINEIRIWKGVDY